MRKKGRLALAGIAAGALSLGLIPFVGAGVANAALSITGLPAKYATATAVGPITLTAPAAGFCVTANSAVTVTTTVGGAANGTFTIDSRVAGTNAAPGGSVTGTYSASTAASGITFTLSGVTHDGTACTATAANDTVASSGSTIYTKGSIADAGTFTAAPAKTVRPDGVAVNVDFTGNGSIQTNLLGKTEGVNTTTSLPTPTGNGVLALSNTAVAGGTVAATSAGAKTVNYRVNNNGGTGAGIVGPTAAMSFTVAAINAGTFVPASAARAGTEFTAGFTSSNLEVGDIVCAAAISAPSGAAWSTSDAMTSGAAALVNDVVTAPITVGATKAAVPGSYSVRVYAPTNGTCATLTSQPILASGTQVVGGAVASFTVAPASQSTSVNSNALFAVSALDSSGRPTLFGAANNAQGVPAAAQFPADSYALTSNSTTTVFTPGATGGNEGASVFGVQSAFFRAKNSVQGVSALTVTANNSAVSAQSATLSTVAANTGTVSVDTPTVVVSGQANTLPVGTPSITFAIVGTGAQVGKQFTYSVRGTGVAAAAQVVNALSPVAVAGPAANSSVALVTVPVANSLAGRTVILESGASTYTVNLVQREIDTVTPPVVVAKAGETVTISGSVTDQFDDPIASASVTGIVTSGPNAAKTTTNAVTSASGTFTVSYSAAATSATDDVVGLTVIQGAYADSPFGHNVTVKYTATGKVNMDALTFATVDSGDLADWSATAVVPYDGTTDTAITNGGAAQGQTGNAIPLIGTTVTPGVLVTYTTTDGWLSDTPVTRWDKGEKSVTALAGTTVYFFSTKTGSVSVSATAGGDTLSGAITFSSPAAAARNVRLSASPAKIAPSQASSVTLTVTDVFGNPATLGSSSVTLQTSLGTLAGGASIVNLAALNALGQATVTLVSEVEGIATVTARGNGGQFANAAGNPFGAPAPVRTASVNVEFTATPEEKSIVVSGYRSGGTVVVEGDATGFSRGDEVKLEIRTYNTSKKKWSSWREKGTAVIKSNGLFTGSVSTSKKVRVRADADGVKSNTVTLPRA